MVCFYKVKQKNKDLPRQALVYSMSLHFFIDMYSMIANSVKISIF